MIVTRALLGAALASALAAPAAAAPTVVTDLGAGARAYVRADPDAQLAGIALVVRAGLDRQSGTQNGAAALVAECVLHTRAGSGPILIDALDARGASLRYTVGVQDVRFYLEGTPEAIAAAAPLVAAALATPSFDPATLAAARDALAERVADDEADARAVARGMLRASYYTGGAALPSFGTPASVAALEGPAVSGFHTAWYKRGDAFVAAVGRTGAATEGAARTLLQALPESATSPRAPLVVHRFAVQPKRIVTQRDVGAPYVEVGFAAPSLGDRDFAAALVLRALLNGFLDRPTAATLPAVFRAAGASYGYDAVPAQLIVWINGSRIEPDVALAAVDAVVKAAAVKPLETAVLDRYKDTARGEWTLQTVTLDERAAAIANAVSHGLPPDVIESVGAAIGRVTGADVQRVAKKYFQRFDVAVVLPRGNGR